MTSLTNPISGVTVPLVTVMSAPGLPDAAAAQPLLRHMAAAGVDNLMLLGSNGEGALLPSGSATEYVEHVAASWRALRPDGRVLVNVTAPGTAEMNRRAKEAVDAGADVLVVSPPSYFRHRDDEVLGHIQSLEDYGLPYAVYNIPRYGNALSPVAFARLVEESPHLVGMKDSSGSLQALREFLRIAGARPGLVVAQGAETELDAGVRMGAGGIVPGIGNIAPELAVALWKASSAGMPESAGLQESVTRLTALHTIRPGVPAIKAILAARGIIPPHVAPPLAACTNEEADALQDFMASFNASINLDGESVVNR